jgi:hypothetical protein
MSISQPRYDKDDKAAAKEKGLPLFTLDIDERHINGRRHTIQGVLHPEWAPVIRLARTVVNVASTTEETFLNEEWVKTRSAIREKNYDFTYEGDEARVAAYLSEKTNGQIGAGVDPVGFLIASHRALVDAQKDVP